MLIFAVVDLRQELAVRERQSDVTRMSAPSSPTQDGVKTDSAVQASLSLPATPLGKGLDNAFASQTGSCFPSAFLPHFLVMQIRTGISISVIVVLEEKCSQRKTNFRFNTVYLFTFLQIDGSLSKIEVCKTEKIKTEVIVPAHPEDKSHNKSSNLK